MHTTYVSNDRFVGIKKLLLIPGFGDSTSDEPYQKIIKRYQKQYRVISYNPQWSYRTATDWLEGLDVVLKSVDARQTTIIAFSLGAYLALLASEKCNFKKVILCSISPLYKEQLHLLPPVAKRYLGKRRLTDFNKHSIPKRVLSKPVFMFGADDWSVGISEAKKLARSYQAPFVLVPDTPHVLTDLYLRRLFEELDKVT